MHIQLYPITKVNRIDEQLIVKIEEKAQFLRS